ncbi:MAG: M20/M25/M40 family metallo-hydrolase [Bacillota bacterium]|nr:M20/M25/M40 family metallo-hydrolase [Bacillota bacterium]
MFFEEKSGYTVKTLGQLVGIPSVSGKEKAVGDFIYECMKEIGMDSVEKQFAAPDRFNVVGRLKGKKPGKTILLTGHMDTVDAGEGWDTDPFTAVTKDGRMYGRGVLDMKSGIAASLNAARIAAMHRDELPGELILAFVPDEEAYSIGVNKLIDEGIKADFGISAEPEWGALIGAMGKMLIKAEAKGVATHGHTPELGVNAIEEMSRFLAVLDREMPEIVHPKMGNQRYVTLKIEGGFKEYSIVVPEHCEALINKHTAPEETVEFVISNMQNVVSKLGLKAKFSFSVCDPYYPAFDLGEDFPFKKSLEKVFTDVTGEKLKYEYGTGVSDNNRLVPLTGIPVICLGCKGAGLHGKNEWVDLESVHQMSSIYQRFLFADKN